MGVCSRQSCVQRKVLPHSRQITWGNPLASAGRDVRRETMEPLEWELAELGWGQEQRSILNHLPLADPCSERCLWLNHPQPSPNKPGLAHFHVWGIPVLFGLPKVFSLLWFAQPCPLSPPSNFFSQSLSHVTLITEAIPEKLYRVTGM